MHGKVEILRNFQVSVLRPFDVARLEHLDYAQGDRSMLFCTSTLPLVGSVN